MFLAKKWLIFFGGLMEESWDSKPDQKIAHRVQLLGRPLSQKNVFENLGPEPPPLKWLLRKMSVRI